MFKKLKHSRGRYSISTTPIIDPDEVLLDASNLPNFDVSQFEGRFEKPIGKGTLYVTLSFLVVVIAVFSFKAWMIMIRDGSVYAIRSEKNRLHQTIIFPQRGVIEDRMGEKLAWNTLPESTTTEHALRVYTEKRGLAHVLGYVQYPAKDKSGFYYSDSFLGMDGVEKYYDEILKGQNGVQTIETDVLGNIQSSGIVRVPVDGKTVRLSIDARINDKLYKEIADVMSQYDYSSGAGIFMDVKTGEILAMADFPEYSSAIMSSGDDVNAIRRYNNNKQKPFLNRVVDGLYTPGSTVKPFIALAALTENIIDPNKRILSTGSISIQNPYDPTKKSVFVDWKAHGWVDMREAIAVSSDVYFYEVGGGFEDQPGLGITKIDKYLNLFGFGTTTGSGFFYGPSGVLPNPAWKAEHFTDKTWRLGDTYNTSIGQYGVQVTPLQMARAVASIANDGKLLTPRITPVDDQDSIESVDLPISHNSFQIVREGMRQVITSGMASGLKLGDRVKVAAKTGTAQVSFVKDYVNSWVIGFFPYDNPKYAFAVVMESGPFNVPGGVHVAGAVIDWMTTYLPEYTPDKLN
ncbi:MAG: penicillin-binding transpeptidase domain-containing protein [Candidatus Paceibacterota bacterium]|jgi:penicillin-binding protein 2